MSNLEDIKSQLARRLEEQAAQPRQSTGRARPAPRPKPAASTGGDGQNSGGRADGRTPGVVKLSVSLYSFDIDRIDKIKEFMRGHGVRNLSDSEALRLACRATPVDDGFLGIYETMLLEDQRRKKARKPGPAPPRRR